MVAVALYSSVARADVYIFSTPTGSMTSGPVSAEADFTTANGSLTITLKNLQPNPKDVAQLLSDFAFQLGTGSSLTGSSLMGASSQELTVNGDGTFSLGANLTTPPSVGWVYSTSSTVDGLLDVLNGPGHAGPAHLVIGPPGGPTYAAANGSIAGNGPHNPFLNQSVTFILTGAGLSLGTKIASATLSFGTTSGVTIGLVPVPEPSPLVLTATTIPLVLGGYRWHRRKRASA
jgi:hypothetical protein